MSSPWFLWADWGVRLAAVPAVAATAPQCPMWGCPAPVSSAKQVAGVDKKDICAGVFVPDVLTEKSQYVVTVLYPFLEPTFCLEV